ncbi:MAG: multidrug efflux MFS transporter [Chloroflexi bacterium]|nr:MAG: multidrug efflux MFS transporter [Chloroflexota bacterium]
MPRRGRRRRPRDRLGGRRPLRDRPRHRQAHQPALGGGADARRLRTRPRLRPLRGGDLPARRRLPEHELPRLHHRQRGGGELRAPGAPAGNPVPGQRGGLQRRRRERNRPGAGGHRQRGRGRRPPAEARRRHHRAADHSGAALRGPRLSGELQPAPAPTVDWRRNLTILWFAQFTAIFGFSFAFPFLPLYLSRDLGVHNTHDLALWTGVVGSSAGLASAIVSPVWGLLADRYGRKSMLIRAMVGGGVSVAAIAAAQTPLQLVILRLLQGALSGTVAATTTIVATGTPREHVGRAMGLLSSAVALGSAVGPFAGGVAANYIGLRYVFLGGGALLLVAVVPVIVAVREAPLRRRVESGRSSLLATIRAAGPGSLVAISVLLVAQSLLQISWSGAQPLVSLRVLQLSPAGAAGATGLAFAAAGVASALAGISYSRLAASSGYRSLAALAAVSAAAAIVLIGIAPTVALVVVATFIAGLFIGAALPAITAMLGLETPGPVQGRVFGLSASATALGFGLGPLFAGTIAGVLNVPVALYTMAGFAVALMVLLIVGGREPAK